MAKSEPIEQIRGWVSRIPEQAQSLAVSTKHGQYQIVTTYTRDEVNTLGVDDTTQQILDACESYAGSSTREVEFFGAWLNGDGTQLRTMRWSLLPPELGTGPFPVDGTPESWSAQLQAFSAQKDRAMIDMLKAFSDLQVQQSEMMRAKLEALEMRDVQVIELRQLLAERQNSDEPNPMIEQRINRLLGTLENLVLAAVNPQGTKNPR